MAKMTLNLDALQVESFEPDPRRQERGTVHGHACSDSTCDQRLCTCTYALGEGMGTCDYSCGGEPCQATHINCSGGGTGGTGGTGGGDDTFDQTCATGNQRLCSCSN